MSDLFGIPQDCFIGSFRVLRLCLFVVGGVSVA